VAFPQVEESKGFSIDPRKYGFFDPCILFLVKDMKWPKANRMMIFFIAPNEAFGKIEEIVG
jgi:hypothetical protein